MKAPDGSLTRCVRLGLGKRTFARGLQSLGLGVRTGGELQSVSEDPKTSAIGNCPSFSAARFAGVSHAGAYDS